MRNPAGIDDEGKKRSNSLTRRKYQFDIIAPGIADVAHPQILE